MIGTHVKPGRASRIRRLLLEGAALSILVLHQPASAASAGAIVVSEPEGFADLTGNRKLLVDVYFAGVRVGETLVEVTPDTIKFTDTATLMTLLPALAERDVLEGSLRDKPLPTNAALLCSASSDRSHCGRLSPEAIGVIFDADRFRVDIFLNPKFLLERDGLVDRYIPAAPAGPSVVNRVSGVISGRTGDGGFDYYIQDQLIAAVGEKRLRADISASNTTGLNAERLAVEWDQPERRYSAGILVAAGQGLFGRHRLLGAGVESQIDTRLDRDVLLGSPIVVFLNRRARVEIRRQAQVLSSAIYEAGNQRLDTSGLPDGSYQITLHIEEAGHPPREETRFYSKSRRIPSQGRTDFFAVGGILLSDFELDGPRLSDDPFVQVGIGHRVSRSWAVDGTVQASGGQVFGEVGLSFLSPLAQARVAALANDAGKVGATLQLSSAGRGPLNFHIDIRHLNQAVRGLEATGSRLTDDVMGRVGAVIQPTLGESFSQASGLVSYSLPNVRFLGTVYFRDDNGSPAEYSLGPAVEWDIWRRDRFTVTLRGDFNASHQGNSGFAGVSVRFTGRRSSLSALAGFRSPGAGSSASGTVGALAGSWNSRAAGGDLALGLGYERQPGQDSVVGSSAFDHALGSITGDLVHSDRGTVATTQYSVGFQSTLAATAGGFQVAGKSTTDSLLVAQIEGAREGDRFEILVDDQVIATTQGGEPAVLKLPSYRAYKVRVRPVGSTLLAYDGSLREVGLYPGVVARLEWTASPVTIKMGRLVDAEGEPLRRASIVGKGTWSQTDERGYFQIEVPDDLELEVVLSDGTRRTLAFPPGEASSAIVRLGTVVCCGQSNIFLGAVDRAVDRSVKR